MVDLSIQKMQKMMCNQTNIRNISVIAHVDHGKSTLTDTLVAKAKIVSLDSGSGRYMDTREDEQERGITIKSTAISMHFGIDEEVLKRHIDQPYEGNEFLINLIDSPGHVDFSSEVTAALRVTDGALVIVDCIDGICVQTETVLRQAVDEKIRPTLVLNKLDRALLELNESPVELAAVLRRRVEDFNVKLQIIAMGNEDSDFKIESLEPEKNQISFCSGLQGWGFALKDMAKFYLKRFNLEKDPKGIQKLSKMLWDSNLYFTGEHPFDPKGTFRKSGKPEQMPFVVFVLNPIYKVRDFCNDGDIDGVKKFLSENYNVNFQGIDLKGNGKNLFKIVMRTWLPAADTLLEQIVLMLPSPLISQKYRASHLYTGPSDDKCCEAIRKCSKSEDDPVIMYVSKMVPYTDNRFIAFGRVFAGVLKPGMKVRIQGPDYEPGSKNDLYLKNIQRTVLMMGRTVKDIESCPAGNIIGLIGIDNELKKTGTITNEESAHNIKSMKFSVAPVVKYAIKPKNPADLPKLKAGLEKLSKSDPLTVVDFTSNNELTIAGAGELHLEISLNDLKNYAGVDFDKGEPQVTYLEGISGTVDTAKMSKSSNKHNKIYMRVKPMSEEMIENINNGKLVAKDPKERAAKFREVMGIRDDWVKKIMFYGPDDNGPNIVVDGTKGISYLNEVKEYMQEGFRSVTMQGPLIGEKLRGVHFELTFMVLHSDAIHRTGMQISAPMTDVCKGLILAANPILYEPIFRVEILVNSEYISGVTSTLSGRRGITEEFRDAGTQTIIIGYMPVMESFGFNAELQQSTKGQASAVLSFSHYSILPGDFEDEKTLLGKTVKAIRKKKGLGDLKKADTYFSRD
ncbi:Elongation factor 2 [Dictyocoela muelleri]|nr:Elongation factor 2 [Dictyocoela muelleri]